MANVQNFSLNQVFNGYTDEAKNHAARYLFTHLLSPFCQRFGKKYLFGCKKKPTTIGILLMPPFSKPNLS